MKLGARKWSFESLVALLMVFTSLFFTSTVANAEVNSSPLDSPEKYIEYLQNYSEEDAVAAGVTESEVEEAINTSNSALEKFKSLSLDEQEKFLSILSNPDYLVAIYAGEIDKLEEDSKYVSWDVSENVSEDTQSPQINTFASTPTRTITHSGTLGLIGIPITEYKITGKYEYNSSGVTKGLSAKGVVVHNYNPTVVTDLTYYSHHISNKKFYGENTFSYKVGLGPVGVFQMGNVYLNIVGDKNGKVSGTFYSE